MSAQPLIPVETTFAVDSSGFSTGQFMRWLDVKYGKEEDRRMWLKLHLTCGTTTNIVTAVHGQREGPYLTEDIQAGLDAGTFGKNDLAWRAGLTKWIPLVSLLSSKGYKCEVCASTVTPAVFRRISQSGWVFSFVCF